jgi:Tfp pilus assembly protein PilX
MLNMMKNKKGVALMSTLFFLIIVTMIATGAIVLSTVQMKVASSITRWERGLYAAEGGINYSIPLLQYAHFDNVVPSQYCASMAVDSPCVAPPAINNFALELQQDVARDDTADLNIPAGGSTAFSSYDMTIDIDNIGTSVTSGGGIEASWAYHGSAYSSSMLKAYRVKATATTPGGSTRTSVCQVIWLRAIM